MAAAAAMDVDKDEIMRRKIETYKNEFIVENEIMKLSHNDIRLYIAHKRATFAPLIFVDFEHVEKKDDRVQLTIYDVSKAFEEKQYSVLIEILQFLSSTLHQPFHEEFVLDWYCYNRMQNYGQESGFEQDTIVALYQFKTGNNFDMTALKTKLKKVKERDEEEYTRITSEITHLDVAVELSSISKLYIFTTPYEHYSLLDIFSMLKLSSSLPYARLQNAVKIHESFTLADSVKKQMDENSIFTLIDEKGAITYVKIYVQNNFVCYEFILSNANKSFVTKFHKILDHALLIPEHQKSLIKIETYGSVFYLKNINISPSIMRYILLLHPAGKNFCYMSSDQNLSKLMLMYKDGPTRIDCIYVPSFTHMYFELQESYSQKVFPDGEQILQIVIRNHKDNLQSIFLELKKLLQVCIDPVVVKDITQYFEKFGASAVNEFNAKENKRYLPQNVFSHSKYRRSCLHPVQIITEKEAEQIREPLSKLKYPNVEMNQHIQGIPHWYSCAHHANYPYVGFLKNKSEFREQSPFSLCCYKLQDDFLKNYKRGKTVQEILDQGTFVKKIEYTVQSSYRFLENLSVYDNLDLLFQSQIKQPKLFKILLMDKSNVSLLQCVLEAIGSEVEKFRIPSLMKKFKELLEKYSSDLKMDVKRYEFSPMDAETFLPILEFQYNVKIFVVNNTSGFIIPLERYKLHFVTHEHRDRKTIFILQTSEHQYHLIVEVPDTKFNINDLSAKLPEEVKCVFDQKTDKIVDLAYTMCKDQFRVANVYKDDITNYVLEDELLDGQLSVQFTNALNTLYGFVVNDIILLPESPMPAFPNVMTTNFETFLQENYDLFINKTVETVYDVLMRLFKIKDIKLVVRKQNEHTFIHADRDKGLALGFQVTTEKKNVYFAPVQHTRLKSADIKKYSIINGTYDTFREIYSDVMTYNDMLKLSKTFMNFLKLAMAKHIETTPTKQDILQFLKTNCIVNENYLYDVAKLPHYYNDEINCFTKDGKIVFNSYNLQKSAYYFLWMNRNDLQQFRDLNTIPSVIESFADVPLQNVMDSFVFTGNTDQLEQITERFANYSLTQTHPLKTDLSFVVDDDESIFSRLVVNLQYGYRPIIYGPGAINVNDLIVHWQQFNTLEQYQDSGIELEKAVAEIEYDSMDAVMPIFKILNNGESLGAALEKEI